MHPLKNWLFQLDDSKCDYMKTGCLFRFQVCMYLYIWYVTVTPSPKQTKGPESPYWGDLDSFFVQKCNRRPNDGWNPTT